MPNVFENFKNNPLIRKEKRIENRKKTIKIIAL
jgi:hypothetical protein